MATDPICGMFVPETEDALKSRRGTTTYSFCSRACVRQFEAPAKEISTLKAYTWGSFVVAAIILVLMFAREPAAALLGVAPPSHEATNLVLLALATPIQFIAGARFYAGFLHAIRVRAANMDTLIALGTTAAYGYSALVALVPHTYGSDTYFDTSVLIIGFILLGRTLEHRMKERATESLRSLVRLQPHTARSRRGDVESDVPIEQVNVGDELVVRPGERIPTDARILEGEADVDESIVSGESVPVHKKVGDEVVGASLNTNGRLVLQASRVGNDTLLAQIQQLVEQAQAGQAPIQRLVDAISAKFVPAVLLIAMLSALAWYLLLDAGIAKAALVFVAVVIIACPCALGLATPAALLVGVGRAAEHGVLVKETRQFEQAAKVKLVLFDKTGTLTRGQLKVTDVVTVPGPDADQMLRIVAAVESASEHPLGKAIVEHAKEKGITVPSVHEFQAAGGRGVRARVEDQHVVVGTPDWLEENGISAAPLRSELERLQGLGRTVVAVGRGTGPLGLVALADTPKPGAAEAVARLHAMGIETALVSGDNAITARAVANEIGIRHVRAPVLPADKANLVEEERASGRIVAMVGDGINDAPALAAADVGIALGSGTDVAREAGGLVLLKDDPRDVPNAIELARKTRAKIQQNLFWAFIYNVALIPAAAAGLLDPILAGAAMGFSSVTVVGNSLMLRSFKPTLASHGTFKRGSAVPAPQTSKRLVVVPSQAAEMMRSPTGSETDPVCHMTVDPLRTPFKHQHGGTTYHFCSARCQGLFAKDPKQFLN